jgi:glutathione S-transferase
MGQSRKPTVFGARYSVYVRSVRLTLEEKAVDYDLVPVDILSRVAS